MYICIPKYIVLFIILLLLLKDMVCVNKSMQNWSISSWFTKEARLMQLHFLSLRSHHNFQVFRLFSINFDKKERISKMTRII